nr:DUF3011 domain-containing protein [Polymorphobacter sp.]
MPKSSIIVAAALALLPGLPLATVQARQAVQTLPAFKPNDGPPNFGPPPAGQRPPSNQLYAGNIRCESQNFRTQRCNVRTQNRVTLVQQQGNSPCRRGQTWRYDANAITVSDGCRGTFAYGYGNVPPGKDSNGNALPWILAGAGATAGIAAIVNSGNNNPPPPEARPAPPLPQEAPPPVAAPPVPPAPPAIAGPPFPAQPPAKIDANLQMLTAAQQPSMQSCLFEGARQVGVGGGSVLRLDGVDRIEQGNGGWRFTFRATGTFPDRDRRFSVFCRSTPTSVIEFTPTGL